MTVALALFFAVALSLVGVVGDSFLKLAGAKDAIIWRWFLLGVIVYASTAIGWFFVIKEVKLTTLGVYYAISTVLFLTFVTVFIFRERLNVQEVIGIILAIVALVLLARFA